MNDKIANQRKNMRRILKIVRGRRHCSPNARRRSSWCIIGVPFVAACYLNAQPYAIDGNSIHGGGGTGEGGGYMLSSTIGQSAAGTQAGGEYVLEGGFWSLVEALQTPGAPRLSVSRTNAQVTVSWPKPAEGWRLEAAAIFASPPAANVWSPVGQPYQTNATHISHTEPTSAGARYYRLRKP